MKRFLSLLLIAVFLIGLLPCMAAAAPADLGAKVSNMPANQNLFITLYNGGDSELRWNASGLGELNSDMHLYDLSGANCRFRLTSVGSGWYGIKFIKENGVDRYIDVAGKSTAEGKVLHIWESDDSSLNTGSNNHRLFAFYEAGTDSVGNQLYYIQIRHSGMWVGLQNNVVGKESKLVQTAVSPRKWYVTPCTVPHKSGEATPWTQSNGLYCELFARNSIQSVSVKGREGNLETNGMGLNLYTIGQSSRWLLRYKSSYRAYEIASTKYETTKGLGLTDKVWDTRGESAGTSLNVWDLQSKDNNDNTSQLWRFIRNSDGSYLIYNAHSGRFVCLNGSDLTQGQRSQAASFVLSPLSIDSTASYGAYFGGSSEELNWMKGIPDTAYLSEINLPASHDTGAMAVVQDMDAVLDNLSITKCQKLYFEEQLATGVRSFDIRCNATSSCANVNDVKIIHGSSLVQCYNRYGKELTLGEILNISKLFLSKHPSETVVLLVKPDAGSHEDLARTLKAYIEANPQLFWQYDDAPTLRQARGKIVLLRRFLTTSENASLAFGPDLTLWDEQDYGAVKGLIKLPQSGGEQTFVQDAFKQTGEAKKEYISGAISDSAKVPGDNYIYNYTSCTLGTVIDIARNVNPWLFHQDLKGKRLGNLVLNYNDLIMNQKIFRSNQFSQPALDPDVRIYHSLNLGSDISLNYMIPKAQMQYYNSFYLSCRIDRYSGNSLSGTETVTLQPVQKGDYYYFVLDNMNAVQMGDQIQAQLYMERDGIRYTSNTDSYSIQAYALSQLNKANVSEELKALCAELLRYGAAAQVFKSYRTDALCDRQMAEAHRSYLQDLNTVRFGSNNRVLDDLESPMIRWVGKGLNMDSRVELLFVFDPSNYGSAVDQLSLKLSYTDIYGVARSAVLQDCKLYHPEKGYYAFRFDDLMAADLRQVVSAVVYENDTPLSATLQYSADSYGQGKTGGLLTVCQAMIAYSDAAKAYFYSLQ